MMARPEPIPHDTLPFAPDATLKIAARIAIDAPAAKAYAALLDLAGYEHWNTFVPSADILPSDPAASASTQDAGPDASPDTSHLSVGTHVMLHVRMKPDAKFTDQEVVVQERTAEAAGGAGADDVHRLAWSALGWSPSALRSLRVMEVRGTGEGSCEFRTWEGMAGPLARAVKFMYAGTLQQRFEDTCRDLKAFCENSGAS